MKTERVLIEDNVYDFVWGIEHCTFVQLIDGSKAVWCETDNKNYWLYFSHHDTETIKLKARVEMSENEVEELEYMDILSDLYSANQRGMYPEVTDEIQSILVGRSIRRQSVFSLNALNESIIEQTPGIIYKISRKALEYIEQGVGHLDAISMAIHLCIDKTIQARSESE